MSGYGVHHQQKRTFKFLIPHMNTINGERGHLCHVPFQIFKGVDVKFGIVMNIELEEYKPTIDGYP